MKLLYTYVATDISREWVKPDFQNLFLRKSIADAKQYYDEIEFYTDAVFAPKIKDIKGINIVIQQSKSFNNELWSLPKIITYEAQNAPFLHIDLDVILNHKPSFDKVLVESIDKGEAFKQIYPLAKAKYTQAYNMGVYGCNDLEFNKLYCQNAHAFIADNYQSFKAKGISRFMPVYFEQLMLAETLEQFNIMPDLIQSSEYIHLKDKKFDLEIYKKYN